jgi:hypothetical protein
MTQTEAPTVLDCIFGNILGFMLPFFLSSAGGDADLASDAIRELADAYNIETAAELELVGRILGFSTVAMDNLRRSMNPDLSDIKVLRYRSNAISLSRASDQCRTILELMQANRIPPRQPVIAAPPPPANTEPPRVKSNPPPGAPASHTGAVSFSPADFDRVKRDAMRMLAGFSDKQAQFHEPAASFPEIPDPAILIGAAVRQALDQAKLKAPRR